MRLAEEEDKYYFSSIVFFSVNIVEFSCLAQLCGNVLTDEIPHSMEIVFYMAI